MITERTAPQWRVVGWTLGGHATLVMVSAIGGGSARDRPRKAMT